MNRALMMDMYATAIDAAAAVNSHVAAEVLMKALIDEAGSWDVLWTVLAEKVSRALPYASVAEAYLHAFKRLGGAYVERDQRRLYKRLTEQWSTREIEVPRDYNDDVPGSTYRWYRSDENNSDDETDVSDDEDLSSGGSDDEEAEPERRHDGENGPALATAAESDVDVTDEAEDLSSAGSDATRATPTEAVTACTAAAVGAESAEGHLIVPDAESLGRPVSCEDPGSPSGSDAAECLGRPGDPFDVRTMAGAEEHVAALPPPSAKLRPAEKDEMGRTGMDILFTSDISKEFAKGEDALAFAAWTVFMNVLGDESYESCGGDESEEAARWWRRAGPETRRHIADHLGPPPEHPEELTREAVEERCRVVMHENTGEVMNTAEKRRRMTELVWNHVLTLKRAAGVPVPEGSGGNITTSPAADRSPIQWVLRRTPGRGWGIFMTQYVTGSGMKIQKIAWNRQFSDGSSKEESLNVVELNDIEVKVGPELNEAGNVHYSSTKIRGKVRVLYGLGSLANGGCDGGVKNSRDDTSRRGCVWHSGLILPSLEDQTNLGGGPCLMRLPTREKMQEIFKTQGVTTKEFQALAGISKPRGTKYCGAWRKASFEHYITAFNACDTVKVELLVKYGSNYWGSRAKEQWMCPECSARMKFALGGCVTDTVRNSLAELMTGPTVRRGRSKSRVAETPKEYEARTTLCKKEIAAQLENAALFSRGGFSPATVTIEEYTKGAAEDDLVRMAGLIADSVDNLQMRLQWDVANSSKGKRKRPRSSGDVSDDSDEKRPRQETEPVAGAAAESCEADIPTLFKWWESVNMQQTTHIEDKEAEHIWTRLRDAEITKTKLKTDSELLNDLFVLFKQYGSFVGRAMRRRER